MQLYKIQAEYLKLLEEYNETENDLDREIVLSGITKLEGDRDEKLKNIIGYYRSIEAKAVAFDLEAHRLGQEHKRLVARLIGLKKYLSSCLPEGETWQSGVFKLSWRKSEALEIDDTEIPPQYTKLETVVDKDGIRETLKIGGTLSFARFVKKQNLQIK